MEVSGGVDPFHVTKAEYIARIERGVYEGQPVELIAGMVLEMAPHTPVHEESLRRLADAFTRHLHRHARTYTKGLLHCTHESLPQPDLFITKMGSYWGDYPAFAHLVVEVADSSARFDRGTKAKLYALSSGEEYWVVDHNKRTVILHRRPVGSEWSERLTRRPGELVSPLAFPEAEIDLSDIFPPLSGPTG